MKNEDYAYAVARIRANEKRLLTDADIESIINSQNISDALAVLASHGWQRENEEGFDLGELLTGEQKRLWTLLNESVPDKSVLPVLTVYNDCFNLKAALKCAVTDADPVSLYVYPTSLNLADLTKAAKMHEFSILGNFEPAAKTAWETLCRTQNGQDGDILIDAFALSMFLSLAKKSGNELTMQIAEFMCATADVKIAVRSARAGKSLSFIKSALAPCRTLDTEKMADLCVQGEDKLMEYLKRTSMSTAAQLIQENSAKAEKWCDDTVTEMTKKAKYIFFGFEPICAYYYAKQTEIKNVRMILGAKKSGLPENVIRERLRALYV